ncbi:MAG: C39 family peptidase [Candidatus Sumerlaeaceae bacterium]
MPRKWYLLLLTLWSVHAFGQNTLGNSPNTVDSIIMVEGARGLLSGANVDNVRATEDGSGITLTPGAIAGSIILKPQQTEFGFNEALPSWNGWAPKDGGFRVWMCPVISGTPAGWFEAGTWGKLNDEPTTRITVLQDGIYNIDTLLLRRPAEAMQIRIDLVRGKPSGPAPVFRLMALSYTNSTGDKSLFARFGRPAANARLSPTSVEVPYRSQVVPNEKVIGRICSPCSVAMTLAAYGIQQDTQDVANELYDRVSDAFGVWHRSVQSAAQHGVRGYVHRFRNWPDVHRELAQRHIICASIRFRPGEVEDPLAAHGKRKQGTLGHLVLIRGINADGLIIVHDTNSKDYGVSSLWKPDQLARAWFDKGGVAYVFTGRRNADKAKSAQGASGT